MRECSLLFSSLRSYNLKKIFFKICAQELFKTAYPLVSSSLQTDYKKTELLQGYGLLVTLMARTLDFGISCKPKGSFSVPVYRVYSWTDFFHSWFGIVLPENLVFSQ